MSLSGKRKAKQLRAAALIADGRSNAKIADELEVDEKTIDRWSKLPAVRAIVDRIVSEVEREVISKGIASKIRRIKAANRRWELLMRVIDERAADPDMQKVAGGSTGALVRELKSIGAGDNNKVVEEFSFDAALFKELRELEMHAAKELGQYGEAASPGSGSGQTKVIVEWVSEPPSGRAKGAA